MPGPVNTGQPRFKKALQFIISMILLNTLSSIFQFQNILLVHLISKKGGIVIFKILHLRLRSSGTLMIYAVVLPGSIKCRHKDADHACPLQWSLVVWRSSYKYVLQSNGAQSMQETIHQNDIPWNFQVTAFNILVTVIILKGFGFPFFIKPKLFKILNDWMFQGIKSLLKCRHFADDQTVASLKGWSLANN